MKLLILSDLHLEFGAFQVPEVEFDVRILAGDIAVPATKAIHWILRAAYFGETKPVIFVPGNHEFYADVLSSGLANMQRAAAGTNVYALACGEASLAASASSDVPCGRTSHFVLIRPMAPRSMSSVRRRIGDCDVGLSGDPGPAEPWGRSRGQQKKAVQARSTPRRHYGGSASNTSRLAQRQVKRAV